MANERNNEDIVWEHFKDDKRVIKNEKGYSLATFEKQSSTNKKIQNILKTSSKNGNGNIGKPEGIISFTDYKNLILFWEGKASKNHHTSLTGLENAEKFAVDGAIHYAKKAVDSGYQKAIALATSGEELPIRVSYHIVEKSNDGYAISALRNPSGKNVEELISLDKMLEFVFPKTTEDRRKSENELRENIHGIMRKASLSEEKKPLVLAACLLALSHRSYKNSYENWAASELGEQTLLAITNYIKVGNLLKVEHRESFIKPLEVVVTHHQLHVSTGSEEKNTYLYQIVKALDESGILESLDPDVIADFYTEFLRYSGGDGKGLGIVLTPHHITDLFAHIGGVNKDSVIIDTCYGTGSFLNSSLRVALADAEGDKEAIARILKEAIVGVELDPKMFTLGATNLLLRKVKIDSLFEGSTFDKSIQDKISGLTKIPDVGLINPPFALKKDGGPAEIEFIEQVADSLSVEGIAVCLVPVSVGADTGKFSQEVKRRILSKHSLVAVMSMPNDLFSGKAGTVVQIIVLKSGVPHSADTKTWFANWTDDGFFIKKHVGRDDYNGVWASRKEQWIEDFKNKKEKTGYSVLKHMTECDEWVTEAYLETDYSTLSSEDFEFSIKQFVLYALSNGIDIEEKGKNE